MEMGPSMNLNGGSGCGLTGNEGPGGERRGSEKAAGSEKDIMDIDNITYEDLSLYSHEEEFSVFHRLDFTRTTGGKDLLLDYFRRPFSKLEPIYATQRILQLMLERLDQWPSSI